MIFFGGIYARLGNLFGDIWKILKYLIDLIFALTCLFSISLLPFGASCKRSDDQTGFFRDVLPKKGEKNSRAIGCAVDFLLNASLSG